MSIDDATMFQFRSWHQENLGPAQDLFSTDLIKRFGDQEPKNKVKVGVTDFEEAKAAYEANMLFSARGLHGVNKAEQDLVVVGDCTVTEQGWNNVIKVSGYEDQLLRNNETDTEEQKILAVGTTEKEVQNTAATIV